MNKPIILLDMDGVICQFTKLVAELFNKDHDDIESNWKYGNWSIAQELGISESDVWKRINKVETFWEDIEPYPYAKDLIKYLKSKYELHICTSPSSQFSCPTGKLKWLSKHNMGFGRNVIITPNKHLLACPNKILLDDMDKNCNKFCEHGGKSILIPRIWNSAYSKDVDILEYIKERL